MNGITLHSTATSNTNILHVCHLCFQRKEGFDVEPSRVAQIVEPNLDMNRPTSGNDDSICQTQCGSGSWCKQDNHCHGCEDIACGTPPGPDPGPGPASNATTIK